MSVQTNTQFPSFTPSAFLLSKTFRGLVLLFALTGWLNTTLLAQCNSNDPTLPGGIVPAEYQGASSPCASLGIAVHNNTLGDGANEFDVALDNVGNSIHIVITVGACGEVLSWTAPGNVVIDRIGLKGNATDQNLYDYPNYTSTDGNLHAPVKSTTGLYADLVLMHICFHYRLDVSKTANTSFTRTYTWGIDNTCAGPANLTLSTDEVYTYPTTWSVLGSYTDSDWKVTGVISITNHTPYPATIESVADLLSGGEPGVVDCGGSFPMVLAAGASLNCSYTASLNAPYNGINTVTVTTSTSEVSGNAATAPFIFRDPTNVVDECITVTNNCQSSFTVCATDLTNGAFGKAVDCLISYSLCGEYTYTNTVGFTTNDTQASGSDNCSVSVIVPCLGGCTLSMGYWKTHSIYGPAPYDNTWALIGENTPFFLSGKTWYQTAWTPPAGNAYYILAHQYIAAQLNFLNGASVPPAVQTAFNTAKTLFNTYTPAQIAILGGNSTLRKQFISLATTLENYNTGITGPGHCSEMNGDGSQNRDVDTVSAEFSLYPNPTSELVNLNLSNFMDQSVDLVMYNQLGSIVLVRHIQQVDSTTYTLTFDKILPNGYYNIGLISGSTRLTKSLIIAN